MSTAIVNGMPILNGSSISMPEHGRWTARLVVQSDDAISGPVVVETEDGLFRLSGTAIRGESFAGVVNAFCVAGTDGMSKTVPPKGYRRIPARTVVEDILREAGEALSPASDPMATELQYWTRHECLAEVALGAIVKRLGMTWRILGDGTVWVGNDSFPSVHNESTFLVEKREDTGTAKYSCAGPFLRPGVKFEGVKVYAVDHSIEPDGVHSTVRTGGEDVVRGHFARLIAKLAPTDDLTSCAYRVVKTNADGSLDLVPENQSSKHPGLSGVRLRMPFPGTKCKPLSGAKVLVCWDDGVADAPSALGFASDGSASEIEINCPSVAIGPGAPTAVAHAMETVASLDAIAASLVSIASGLNAQGPLPLTGVTAGAAVSAAASALQAALAALKPKIPANSLKAT